jgi:glycosyltransferase involved in cell wall biosynthesis
VTDIPSNQEWISDGENGFLVPIKNETVLAKKVVEAIRNNSFLYEASKRNRKIIEEKAHWKKNINKISEIYERSPRLH